MIQGKAKDEFEKWLMNGNDGVSNFGRTIELTRLYFLSLKETCQQSLIIDWFSTLKYKGQDFWLYVFEFYYEQRIDSMTISDINTKSIEKAVEIFNQLNN
jgi:hypothetical protein